MNEELEFLISQYADGTLGAAESRALEAWLADDAEARVELEKHRRLIGMLREMPMPQVAWDRLAARIDSAIANAPEAPVSYRLFAGRFAWTAAGLAATVLIAAGVAIRMFVGTNSPSPTALPNIPLAVARFAHVIGPRAQVAIGPAVTDVSIGPGKGVVAAGPNGFGELAHPPRVLVESSAVAMDDTAEQMPF